MSMKFSKKAVLGGALVAFATLVLAADGDLDTTFDAAGAHPGAVNVSFPSSAGTDALSSARKQADNTYLVAGVQSSQNNGNLVYIATLNADGTVSSGTPPVTVDVTKLATGTMAGGANVASVPVDGAVYVTGQGMTNNGTLVQQVVTKLNSAGVVQASYARPNGAGNESGGGNNVIVETNAATSGKVASEIIVGSRNATSGNRVGVLRLNSDLTPDTTFGSGGTALLAVGAYPTGYVSADIGNNGVTLLEDSSGNYYILAQGAANFTTGTNPKPQNKVIFVAKFDTNGTPVAAFGNSNNGIATLPISSVNCTGNSGTCQSVQANGMAFDGNGNIVVVGQMQDPSNAQNSVGYVARLSASTGAMDQAFGSAGTGVVIENFQVNGSNQGNGVVANSSGIYYLTYTNLFRLNNSTGAVDNTFNSAATNVSTLNNKQTSDTSNWFGIALLDANNALVLGGVDGYCVGVNLCGQQTLTSSNQAVVAKVRLVTDTTPDAFTFNAVSNQQLGVTATSNTVTISGINSAAPISVSGTTGSAYSIGCNGTFTSAPGTINNGQTVCVHHTTSSSPNTSVSTTLNIGGVTGTFTSTTVPADTTPNAYSFAAATNQPTNTPVASQPATITGINTAAPVSISGGTNPGYSVGCTGTYTSANGTINNNQTVCVRVTSANAPNTSTSTTLNVGGVTASFQVTTANGPVVSLSSNSLSFGSHPTGTTSASQSVTLTNTGTAALNISTIVMAGDYALANTSTCANGGTVAAGGGSCKIDVTFSPTTTGARPGSVTINSNAASSPDTITLSGTGTGPVPAVTLNPTSLSFPGQNVGTTSTAMSSTLTNTGTASLTITSLAASAHYAVVNGNNSCPTGTPIAVNASCTINVTYSPTAATANGADTGNVTIMSNDPNSPTFLTLSGTGLAPIVGLSPNPRTFPDTNVGSTSAAQTVTLSNSGNGTLNISSISVSPAEYAKANTGTCGATLGSGQSCAINITFTPAATGARPGTLTVVTGNASPLQYTVNLSGNGTTPATATLSPTTLSFGGQNVGTTSAAQTVTLSNSGTLTLNNIVISHTGDYATPAAATNPCGTSLAGGASCNISVTFAPTATGSRPGTLTVSSSAGTSGATLSGTGTTPPTATLSTPQAFPAQLVGTTSAPQTITLTNSGTLPLNNIAITHTGDYATPTAASNPCGVTLAGGTSCNISVTFTPTATGTRTGTLTVSSSAPAGNSVANLSGTGIAPALTLSPTTLTFPQTTVGSSSAVQTSTLTNSGTAALNVGAIAASGDYTQTNDCPATLTPNAHCTISVTFTPSSAGTRTGSVSIASNAASSPDHLGLTGTSVSTATTTGTGGQSVTLTVDQGVISNFTSSPTPTSGLPSGVTFPLGFFTYTVTGLPTTGTPATVHLSFTLPSGTGVNGYTKCSGGSCGAFSGATVNGNTLTLTITDNAAGDGNASQGTIVDPGAPSVTASTDNGGGAMGWATLLFLGVPGFYRLRRRSGRG